MRSRLVNEGKGCHSKCGEGLCPGGNFCGHAGRCCRANQIKDDNSGCKYACFEFVMESFVLAVSCSVVSS